MLAKRYSFYLPYDEVFTVTDNIVATDFEQTARRIELSDLQPVSGKGRSILDENHEIIRNIKVRLTVSVGKCTLTVRDLLGLKEGSVLTLDKETREPVDILLDGKLIARGDLIAIGDSFGVRISEILAT